VLFLALAAAPAAASEDPVSLGPCGPITRQHGVVEVPVPTLQKLGGTPLSRLGLIAFRDGRPSPIPFQVDEKRGRKIALGNGSEPTDDDKPQALDADDVLLFMACDAGTQAPASEVEAALGEVSAWREIRVDDSLTHASAFAYLAVAERPPTTTRRYVAYDAAGDLVRTAAYRVGLVNALPTYLSLSLTGTVGPNLLDGARLRAEATLLANLAHWTLNEQQGRHALIAWKVGPIRVVRRSRHHVSLGLGIELSAGIAHTYFYPRHVYGPGSMKLPFSPGVFFRDIRAFGGADGRDMKGWRYHAPGVPRKGFLVDGEMDDAERAYTASGDWFVLSRAGEAIMFVTRMSEDLKKVVPLHLIYRDDTAPNPPEASPGTVPLVGYEGRGVERLPGGRYTFALNILGLEGYQSGDERRLLDELDVPLTITVPGPPASP
jgi:hypothetical protein